MKQPVPLPNPPALTQPEGFFEPDDVILHYLDEHEAVPQSLTGWHVIPYGANVYIVLADSDNAKPIYIGWFAVTATKLNNAQYRFLGHFGKWFLYRCECDYQTDSAT